MDDSVARHVVEEGGAFLWLSVEQLDALERGREIGGEGGWMGGWMAYLLNVFLPYLQMTKV